MVRWRFESFGAPADAPHLNQRVKDFGGGLSNLFLQNFVQRACFAAVDSVTWALSIDRSGSSSGRLAQLVSASALHAVGRGFESLIAHHFNSDSSKDFTAFFNRR